MPRVRQFLGHERGLDHREAWVVIATGDGRDEGDFIAVRERCIEIGIGGIHHHGRRAEQASDAGETRAEIIRDIGGGGAVR